MIAITNISWLFQGIETQLIDIFMIPCPNFVHKISLYIIQKYLVLIQFKNEKYIFFMSRETRVVLYVNGYWIQAFVLFMDVVNDCNRFYYFLPFDWLDEHLLIEWFFRWWCLASFLITYVNVLNEPIKTIFRLSTMIPRIEVLEISINFCFHILYLIPN